MELRHLRYFLAIVETKSFTRAAAKLDISQPTLSQQIGHLESMLGSALFTRLGRTIGLTSAGKILVPYARQSIQAANDAKLEIANAADLAGGTLRIAFIPGVRAFLLPAIVRFTDEYQKVKLELRAMAGSSIHRVVSAGECELGFATKGAEPPEIAVRPLYTETMVLAFRRGHPLENLDIRKLHDIGDTPFAAFSQDTLSVGLFESYFRKIKFRPNIRFEVETLMTFIDLLASTDTCALLPENAVTSREDVSYRFLPEPAPTRPIALLRHRRAGTSVAARKFMDIVQLQIKR